MFNEIFCCHFNYLDTDTFSLLPSRVNHAAPMRMFFQQKGQCTALSCLNGREDKMMRLQQEPATVPFSAQHFIE